jgi:hypothetical protein
MITFAIMRSTFRIRCGDSLGTSFAIDHDNKQYLITAKHIGTNWDEKGVDIFHDGEWKRIPVKLVGHCNDPIDISVFSPAVQLTGAFSIPASAVGVSIGQDMYFLGFPYGLSTEVGELNQKFPFPLVKRCCLSGSGEHPGLFYFDGMNNPGFSGGPIIREISKTEAMQDGSPVPTIKYQYTAVISGYRQSLDTIVRTAEEINQLITLGNSGIVLAYSVDEAIAVIKKNPIGFQLPDNK